jgi:phosphoserine phosphatase
MQEFSSLDEALVEKICNTYSVIIVDLDDTLLLNTGMEEFLVFHIRCRYSFIGILKIKLANMVSKFLKIFGFEPYIIIKVYADLLLLGERLHDLQYSVLLYLYDVIKNRRIRIDLFRILIKCRKSGKTLILATSNVDLVANAISRYVGFHYIISSKISCNIMCRLEQRIDGMEKLCRLVKFLKTIKSPGNHSIIYIVDKWSLSVEKADRYLKNVLIV